MNAKYIPVGSAKPQTLALTTSEISAFLLADWLPDLPASLGTAFFGWPDKILTVAGASSYLTIRSGIGNSERQWKGVVSWMLGVAGARRILSELGYRWVAPASAFYPEAVRNVNLSWPDSFPRTSLSVMDDPLNPSHLRPDYIALRPIDGGTSYEVCAAEAKGTTRALLIIVPITASGS